MTDELIFEEWDLAEAISESRQINDTVIIYLNKELSYTRAELEDAAARADAAGADEIAKRIAEIDEEMERYKYVVHLRTIPRRMQEDIHSKALSQHPIKLAGMFVDENEEPRKVEETIRGWNAQVVGITNPAGKTRPIAGRDLEDTATFYHGLPSRVQSAINAAISDLNDKSERYSVGSRDPNFSSGN